MVLQAEQKFVSYGSWQLFPNILILLPYFVLLVLYFTVSVVSFIFAVPFASEIGLRLLIDSLFTMAILNGTVVFALLGSSSCWLDSAL